MEIYNVYGSLGQLLARVRANSIEEAYEKAHRIFKNQISVVPVAV